MAIRAVRGGFQTYGPDPFKKKKKRLPPEKKKVVVPKPKPKPEAVGGVFVSKKTGKPSGIALPGGRVHLGLSAAEVATIQERRGLQELPSIGEAATAARRKREAGAPLEEAGAFEQVTPREVGLAARPQPGEQVPVLGREIAITQSILFNAERQGWIPDLSVRDPVTGEEAFPGLLTPETLREAALREVSKKSFEQGVSLSESFGAFVESIPLVGGLVGRYVGGLVEAPYSNTMHALDEINRIKEAASTGQEKVRNGLEDPDYGLDRARSMEEDIAKLEGRIKILIGTSAILQANTDQVNKIQEQILEAREKVARYRRASSFGLTASLTGTGRVVPTDEQIYFELKEQNT